MIEAVRVVVPARDEQDEIGACLTALMQARARLLEDTDGRIAAQVVVVLDRCRDHTAGIVATFPHVRALVSDAGCVGGARRVGAAALSSSPHHWLASTDADTQVPEEWLVHMLRHAARGADLVLGRVRPAPGIPAEARLAWARAHPDGQAHRNVHAANLGIRASTYAQLGGWRELACHEDVDLVARAQCTPGTGVHWSDDTAVTTSSRLTGRAPDGFAAYLSEIVTTIGEPPDPSELAIA